MWIIYNLWKLSLQVLIRTTFRNTYKQKNSTLSALEWMSLWEEMGNKTKGKEYINKHKTKTKERNRITLCRDQWWQCTNHTINEYNYLSALKVQGIYHLYFKNRLRHEHVNEQLRNTNIKYINKVYFF